MSDGARPVNWRVALVEYAERMRGRPYVWGDTDCAALAADCVLICSGVDIVDEIGRWVGPREALRRAATLTDPSQPLVDHGALSVPQSRVQTGDVVVWPETHGRLPRYGVILPCVRVLTSGPETGVVIGSLTGHGDPHFYRMPA